MKKKDLILKSAQASCVSTAKAASVIDSFLEEVVKALSDGEKIMISGFGTFEVKERAGRIGRHPVTGEEIQLSNTKIVSFHQSTKLREKINTK
ncbi:MAG: HU family DNA-binding protein [Clostridia bacterium]|nr:HU family DNA-binding protein [Clostridia bacterium]MBR3714458.1 HU family DNA-binding protein [Clostridia bacterium]